MRLPPSARLIAIAIALLLVRASAVHAQKVVNATEDLRIDADEQNLAPIWYLWVSPKGVMVASQQADRHFRFFSPDGKPLGTFGRKGSGPGEFQGVEGSRAGWMGDTLWLTESSTKKLTLVGPDLKLVRVDPLPIKVLSPSGEEIKEAQMLYPFVTGIAADRALLMSSAFRPKTNDLPWLPASEKVGRFAFRAARDGRFLKFLGGVEADDKRCQFAEGSATVSVPYCARHLVTEPTDIPRIVLAAPGVVSASEGRFRIVVISTNTGDTLLNRDLRYRPAPIPSHVVDSIRRKYDGDKDYPPTLSAMYKKVPFPAYFPPFRNVLTGRDGTIAIEIYTSTGAKAWRFLSARGDELGTIAFPPSVRIFAIEKGRAWGTDGEEGDQDSIVRYHFP